MDLHNTEQAPIVILAARIIEDISELCAQMADLNRRTSAIQGLHATTAIVVNEHEPLLLGEGSR